MRAIETEAHPSREDQLETLTARVLLAGREISRRGAGELGEN